MCLCIVYALKAMLPKFPNRFIPILMLGIGLMINTVLYHDITPEILLSGMLSGLLSTGSYEVLKNAIKNRKK